MPKIKAYALASSEGLSDVVLFALLTIQQPFHRMAAQFNNVKAFGETSPYLFGAKRKGFAWLQENREFLYRVTLDILAREDGEHRKADLIQHFMQVPGLGIVKAAFVVQMIGGGTACLDRHNLTILGMPEDAFATKGKPPTKMRDLVLKYIRTCDRVGTSEHWWNRWCEYVAGRRQSPLKSGDAVSAFHAEALGLA